MKFGKLVSAAIISAGVFGSTASYAETSFRSCLNMDPVRFDGTIVDAAIATPDLSTLVTAVTAAGLGDALATLQDLTVFAPTNAAFDNIPAPILSEILADVDVLTAVLTYHVAPGYRDPRLRLDPKKAETLAGQDIFFQRKDRAQRVNDAIVSCTPVRTDNGTVFLIDSVLMPQF